MSKLYYTDLHPKPKTYTDKIHIRRTTRDLKDLDTKVQSVIQLLYVSVIMKVIKRRIKREEDDKDKQSMENLKDKIKKSEKRKTITSTPSKITGHKFKSVTKESTYIR